MTDPTRRYENDLPRFLLFGAVIGLVALLLTVIAYTIGTHSSSTSPPTASAPTGPTSSPGGSQTAAGKQVFIQSGCGGCHAFSPAGTNATIGPNLDGVSTAAAADNNMALTAYIRQSIIDPDAYITPSYHAGIMPTYYSTKLTAAQIAQLVAFIASGQKR